MSDFQMTIDVDYLRAVMLATDSDDRISFASVCFEIQGKKVFAIATDGKRLHFVEFHANDESKEGSTLVDADDLKKVLRLKPKRVRIDHKLSALDAYDQEIGSIEYKKNKNRFPDWRSVVSNTESCQPPSLGGFVPFDPGYIIDAARACKWVLDDEGTMDIFLHLPGKNKGYQGSVFKASGDGVDLTCVVMSVEKQQEK